MSWSAKRFGRNRKRRSNWNWHHVPPRNPAKTLPIKLRVRKIDHEAYNQLFQNAASLEQCIAILRRDWWPNAA